jgi:hypothetical protein
MEPMIRAGTFVLINTQNSRIQLTQRALNLSKPAQHVLESGRQLWQKQLTDRELATLERLLKKVLAVMEEALLAEQSEF